MYQFIINHYIIYNISLDMIFPSLIQHLYVVEEFACPHDLGSCVVGDMAPGSVTQGKAVPGVLLMVVV